MNDWPDIRVMKYFFISSLKIFTQILTLTVKTPRSYITHTWMLFGGVEETLQLRGNLGPSRM